MSPLITAGNQRFAWCSQDPETNELVPYDLRNCQTIEAAFVSERKQVPVKVRPTTNFGVIAYIHFNCPEQGQHQQKSISGLGLRKVARATQSRPSVDFGDGVVRDLPDSAFVSFRRVAWVTVEPVKGILQPYTRENALILETSYRSGDKDKRIAVKTKGGDIEVRVAFDYQNHVKHQQRSNQGLRSVQRVVRDAVDAAGCKIPLYRRPKDGSVDSQRYRLEQNEEGASYAQVGELKIPEAMFMAETQLSMDTFSPVKEVENAVLELGYQLEELEEIANRVKEEPMRLAGIQVVSLYRVDAEVPLYRVCGQVLKDWADKGIITPGREADAMQWTLDKSSTAFQDAISKLFNGLDPNDDFVQASLLGAFRQQQRQFFIVRKVAAAVILRVLMASGPSDTNSVGNAVSSASSPGVPSNSQLAI